jgi:outer membrane receptor protein involved in Fe transport
LIPGAALAQQATAPQVESVVVSASRISIDGYAAPTPVTVISEATLERDAHVDIGDSIRELPSVGRSSSPNNGTNAGHASQGDSGLNSVNLRDLGALRTLVLFDGQRVVSSNPTSGGVDLSTLPSTVVQRVDVVTGGASAAWGSDAVAGVVNLVINKNFSGIKGNVTFGDSYKDDHRVYKGEIFAGTDFDGSRGHIEAAADYTMSSDTVFALQRDWYHNRSQIFPASSFGITSGPRLVHVYNAVSRSGSAIETNGGLITANPEGTVAGSANILRGIQFVGPNAQPVPFNFGNLNNSTCTNCSATPYSATNNPSILAVPYHSLTLFGYGRYSLTNDITASAQLNYGQFYEQNDTVGRSGKVIIHGDNPFIPTPVKNIMAANGISSFTLGTSNQNNQDPHNITLASMPASLGQSTVFIQRQLMRGVVTLDGAFGLLGQDWSWTAYAQDSSVRVRERIPLNTFGTNYGNAVDAITVAATGPNSLGGGNPALAAQVASALTAAGSPVPQVGQIACRSSLTATSWGTVTDPKTGITRVAPGGYTPTCVPIDLFGEGVASRAAANYIAPGRVDPSVMDQATWLMNQVVFSASAQGELPWGLPAGNIAVATGLEHRLEQQRQIGDPLGLGASGTFSAGNVVPFAGQYYEDEGFVEVNAPLLKNDIVQSLDLNAAGRLTDYSTSGLVKTWKLGLTSQVNDDVRLRATLSADIRAPDITELFTKAKYGVTPERYPPVTGPSYNIYQVTTGNPDLTPEQATTVSGGVVLTPHWIDNLSLSFDWYSISIHKAIYQTGFDQILSQCNLGNAIYCGQVYFANGWPGSTSVPVAQEVNGIGRPASGFVAGLGTFPADCEACVNMVISSPLNATTQTVSGLDFQADYHFPLFGGVLDWHLIGNYTDENSITALGIKYDGAGSLDDASSGDPLAGTTSPKFRATLSANYALGPYAFTVQTRVIGAAELDHTYVVGVDIDKNYIPPTAYLDLRASYQWDDSIQLYGAVDNVLNTPPAEAGGPQIYDVLGRSFRIGVRFTN